MVRRIIQDGGGGKKAARVLSSNGFPNGLMTYTHPYRPQTPEVSFAFVDENGSADMNVAVTFTGTPEGIHNGGDNTYWTASVLAGGGTWDFTSATDPNNGTGCIDATGTVNNSEALFTDSGGGSIDFDNYTAVTGFVRLESFSAGDGVEIRFRNSGTDVGNPVDISGRIDTTSLDVYQKFVVPKGDFGINGDTVNEFVVKTIATGASPNYRLDDIQIEETGEPKVFTVTPPKGFEYHVRKLTQTVRFTDSSIVTVAGATENETLPKLDTNKFFGLTKLTVGQTGAIFDNGVQFESLPFRCIYDILQDAGSTVTGLFTDGEGASAVTTVQIELNLNFPEILKSSTLDKWTQTINDDLSTLLNNRMSLSGLLIPEE